MLGRGRSSSYQGIKYCCNKLYFYFSMVLMNSSLVKVIKFVKLYFKKDFRILLPQLYALGIIVGFVLTLLYATFPGLSFCSELFGDQFCTPAGIYLGLFISLPGYLIAGNLFSQLPTLSGSSSFLIVIVTSGIFYFLLGLLIDKFRKKTASKTGVFIVAVFVVLLLILLLLYSQL